MSSARVVIAALLIAGSAGVGGVSADSAGYAPGTADAVGWAPATAGPASPTAPVAHLAPPAPAPSTPRTTDPTTSMLVVPQAVVPPSAAAATPDAVATPEAATLPEPTAEPTLGQLVGQKLVVSMAGITAGEDMLGRVRRGEIGGVILFGSNVATESGLIELAQSLQQAAAEGGQPPLLIAVDQEGGSIKRIPWAPPNLSATEMGGIGDAGVAREEGAATGAALRALGINVDLAPVADVPGSAESFMHAQGRTFSLNAEVTALLSDAFAAGLGSAGVTPTLKHFPGIGLAMVNTDARVVAIDASAEALARGLLPYRRAIANHSPLIMLSNATYSAYDSANAAGWSTAVGTTLLRDQLGFRGATITDSLDGTANARGLAVTTLAVGAFLAGTDLILTTGSESSSRAVYDALLHEAQSGSLSTTTLRASYARILALKVGY